jgi:type I restriction enzyme S subunit
MTVDSLSSGISERSDLPVLPDDWRWVLFSETCERISVGHVGPTTEFFTDSVNGVTLLRSQNVRPGKLDLIGAISITHEFHSKLRKSQLKSGDILFTRVGANRGDCCVVPTGVGELNCANIIFARPKYLNGFHAYFFQSALGRNLLLSASVGAAQGVINTGSVAKMPVPFPPLATQQRIAGILSAYDELIENSQRRIKILESMARALYREWFVHFRFPGYESHTHVPSTLGDIPLGWEVKSFGDLLVSMTGGDWGSEIPEDRDTTEVIVVRGTDFDEVAYGGQIRSPVRYIKPSSFVSRGLKVGDVIIENSINAKSRSVGTTLLVDSHVLERLGHDAIAASFCKVLRLHDPKLAPLVHLRARHLREDARMEYFQNVAANGIANFQAQKFAKEEGLTLPKDEAVRSKLIEPIASIFQRIGVAAAQLSNLRRTRDLLLPRLLSGQINVDATP